jgi:glycerophosphoryl diester phosphodiesterase
MTIPLFASATAGPFISAHRGFSDAAPENTLPALQAALEAGAHVAEIDVKLTRDGQLVLMHDALVDRTTDGKGPVGAMTLAEVKQLDAGRWFDRKFAGTRVPTLDEVLAWSRGRLGILVEMKSYPERDPRFIDEVIAAIKRNQAEDFAIPASFDHPSLAEIHRREPEWALEMIINCRLADTVHAARAAGSVLLSLEPEFTVKGDVAEMHAAGLSVLTTLLSAEHGGELLEMGVDIFESSDVQLVRQTLRRLGRGLS